MLIQFANALVHVYFKGTFDKYLWFSLEVSPFSDISVFSLKETALIFKLNDDCG